MNVLSISAGLFFFLKLGGINYVSTKISLSATTSTYKDNPYYIYRTDLFKAQEIPEDSIVFIGDSITHRALMNELFPNVKAINRGIDSDTTEGVKNRLEDIVEAKPKQIYLLVGINDIYAGVDNKTIVDNYKEILNFIKSNSTDTEVFIQSILPINDSIFIEPDTINNDDVKNVNKDIERLAKESDYIYIDLYETFAPNDQLKESYSDDGIHLNGEGYKVWKEIIEKNME